MSRFDSKPLDDEQIKLVEESKALYEEIDKWIEEHIGSGRYRSIAITQLEISSAMLTKAISRHEHISLKDVKEVHEVESEKGS